MGADSGIAWTDHTFNPWWGCVKVSPACTNCYAETFDKRLGGGHWGPEGTRKFFGDKHWTEPLRWDHEAWKRGVREKVFCASMADVFEDRPELVAPRARLFDLIASTQNLDWLLLTKRPENFATMLPWGRENTMPRWAKPWPNVWLGTTVESQEYADERVPLLMRVPAVVRFLSVEPMLGRVDLATFVGAPDWIIVGCESGHGARPQNLDHVRSLRDDCETAGITFFLKQLEANNASDGLVTIGAGSWAKGPRKTLIEQPYLDGVQHVAFPTPRTP